MKALTMDDILNSKLGAEGSGDIRVIFQKKTAVKQFEPELIEVEATLRVEDGMGGPDRMLAAATLLTQVEYTCFVQLLAKKQVTPEEFNARKEELLGAMQALTTKYKALTGKEPTDFFDLKQ